jgi:hypothetical protein
MRRLRETLAVLAGVLLLIFGLGAGVANASPAGTVKMYPGIDDPIGITAGPDGALWFTNYGNNSIGRITTTGVVHLYAGAGIDDPDGITAGPDGAHGHHAGRHSQQPGQLHGLRTVLLAGRRSVEEFQNGGGELGRTVGVHLVPGRDDLQGAVRQPGGGLRHLVLGNVAGRPAGDHQGWRRDAGEPVPPGRVGLVELGVDGGHHRPVER